MLREKEVTELSSVPNLKKINQSQTASTKDQTESSHVYQHKTEYHASSLASPQWLRGYGGGVNLGV